MKYFSLLLVGLLLGATEIGLGDEIVRHVSPRGNDSHEGTQDRPFATLTRARQAIREWKNVGNEEPSFTVVLHAGRYELTEPLRFDHSDADNGRVTFRAAENEMVRISGGKRITAWESHGDVWTASVPNVKSFRQFYVNGERRPRARHPNDGWLRIEKAASDRRSGFSFASGTIPAFDAADGPELVFLHDWSTSRIPIRRLDSAKGELETQFPIGPNAPHYAVDHFEPHPRFRVENARALLDAPGEWFFNSAASILHYRPLPGEDPNKIEAIVPQLETLIEVRGTSAKPVRGLQFDGLLLEHAGWQLPPQGFAGMQACFYELRGQSGPLQRTHVPGAVQFEWAEGCSIRNGGVFHFGGSGIEIGSGCRRCEVSDTVLRDISGNGLMIGEGTLRKVNGRGWWQAAPAEAASDNVVTHCLIEDCGRDFFGSVGVWVGLARNTKLAENELRQLPYTGISLGWMWNPTPTPAGGNVIERNHIHHIMQTLSDGGGIYTLGRQPGTLLRQNHIHDVPVNAGRAESNGMFLDEGSTELVIEENVIYAIARSPLRFHQAGENVVRRNQLMPGENLPAVRYNSTPERNIHLEENQVVSFDSPLRPDATSLKAGLSPDRQRRLEARR